MRRGQPVDQARILAEALARVRARAPYGVVVLDLDSTLLDNRPRQARILADYGRAAGIPALAAARPDHFEGWSLERALRNAGLTEAEARRHEAPFRAFWRERFFTSAYCREDVPIPGAPGFVLDVVCEGGIVAYVTGRPAAMADGTLEALARAGFPLPNGRRVRLLMKPSPEVTDDDWKAQAMGEVERLGPVVAAFDNEPAHVNAYARAWPGALTVHLDTDHSARPDEPVAPVPSIADFRTTWGAGVGMSP
jgi:hypothetical protein